MAEALWASYRLFPYERALALREVEALTGHQAAPTDSGITVPDEAGAVLVERATYFGTIKVGSQEHPTLQSSTEALHAAVRGVEQRRQATRFGLHGIHEYKGKFNPQLVRSLINVVDADADLLIDPFCGSGTSLIEANRLGVDALGIDKSPIAAMLARSKCAAVVAPDTRSVRERFSALFREVADAMKEAQQSGAVVNLADLFSPETAAYLHDWFPQESLAAVAVGLRHTSAEITDPAVALTRVALSAILRAVSFQLPEDLRVRRRPEPFDPPQVWELFIETCERVELGLEEVESWPRSDASIEVRQGSSSDPAVLTGVEMHRRRLVVTSPPYATALPYIDTDRLSIVALGLAPAAEIRVLERELVGSREWRKPQEREWWSRLDTNADSLPPAVVDLTAEIHRANEAGGAGFRRAAVPALLYRYFASMAACMDTWHKHLEPDERVVLIVGNNRTTANGEEVVIPTPHLLGGVAETRGYDVDEIIPLETWPRYGMHSRNGVSGEDAVVLRRR